MSVAVSNLNPADPTFVAGLYTNALGTEIPGFWYTQAQFDELRVAVEKEMSEDGNRWQFWVVTGRKPANL